ncbi:mpv17-like protein isoform 1-T1 [Pluvialis apricaria]
MAGALLRGGVRRFPWLCNVLLYGGLFAAGDAAQQLWRRRRRGQPPDWAQTRRVALVALAFHGNFSYVWLRALERALPGRRPPAVLGKVLCDQLLGAPVAVLAFYTGMSILQRKEDIFSDCKKKFWNTYKTGLMYWPFVQFINLMWQCPNGLHPERKTDFIAKSIVKCIIPLYATLLTITVFCAERSLSTKD